jgi:AraC-like DNA-binding protein
VKDYIQQQRTERAKDLLQSGKRIADTDFETGYFDQSHFHKSFRKMWGATPASIS